jgi:cytoskeletal protein CcmA (bactofilin family)
MFARKDSKPGTRSGRLSPSGLSFIGTEVVISGDLTTSAQLHVDGRIDGHVRCGQLCQGESGIIAGDLTADEARIAGLVEGTVNAATLIVEATGRITGDVTYETISIAAGARIDGRLARRAALAAGTGADDMLIATPTAAAPVRGKAASSTDLFPGGGKPEALVVD